MEAGIVILLLGVYFIPSIVAIIRDHSSKGGVIALNILLGWTFIGWVISIVWSFTNSDRVIVQQTRSMSNSGELEHVKMDTEFEEEWELLCRYDSNVKAQVERLQSLGEGAVNELKRVYKVTKDKQGLKEVADQIILDTESGRFDPQVSQSANKKASSADMFAPEELDSKGLNEDRTCQVFQSYQVRKRDDGKWWIEMKDGTLHPLFARGYANLGTAKRKAASTIPQ